MYAYELVQLYSLLHSLSQYTVLLSYNDQKITCI
jgi:hypothetical protein